MNVKISVFVICAEAIYLLLFNLHDCTLKNDEKYFLFHFKMVKHTQTIEKYFLFHFKMVKHTQTICRQIADELLECV